MIYTKRTTNSAGFTLIELLLYVSVVGTLLIGVVIFAALGIDARVKNQSVSEVNQQGNFAIDYIDQTIRGSNSITAPVAGASGSSLTLVVPTGGLSPTIFDISAGVLRVKEGAAAVVPLTNNKVQVTNLTFTNLSRASTNGIMRVSITLSRVNPNNRNEYDFTKTFIASVTLRQ
jgi:type II secretory pathway pseudopilin PulG